MNPILEKTKAETLKRADPRLVPVIEKTVEAGKKIMYSPETREFTLQAMASPDPEAIGAAVAKLAALLFNQSQNKLPPEVLIPACTILLCEGLQFMEDGGGARVDANLLAACTKAMGSAVLQMFGVTPDRIQGMMGKGGQPAPSPVIQGAQGGQA